MSTKTTIGAAAIILGTVLVFALAGLQNGVPHLVGGVGVLAMALGSLMVGMAGDRAV